MINFKYAEVAINVKQDSFITGFLKIYIKKRDARLSWEYMLLTNEKWLCLLVTEISISIWWRACQQLQISGRNKNVDSSTRQWGRTVPSSKLMEPSVKIKASFREKQSFLKAVSLWKEVSITAGVSSSPVCHSSAAAKYLLCCPSPHVHWPRALEWEQWPLHGQDQK